MENDVKVSIMVLAYNHESYIRQALDSIVNQKTDFKFEAIIGEDCSKDKTREIIKEYANTYPEIIKPLFRKKNLGACKNVVSTLRRCKGEYVAFLECDDYWIDPYKLQKQVAFLEKNKDYAGVMGNALVINRYGKTMVTGPKILDHEMKTPLDFAKTAYPYNQFKFIASLLMRNVFITRKYEKYLLQTVFVDDVILWAICLINGPIGFLKDYQSAYRWVPSHGGNFSSLDRKVLCRDKILALRVVMKLFPNNTYPRLYMRIARDYWILFHGYMQDDLYKELYKLILFEMSVPEKFFYLIYYIIRKTFKIF